MNKLINLDFWAARFFLAFTFLVPLFVLPIGNFPVDFSKAMFSYIAVSVIFLLVLISRFARGSVLIPKSLILSGLLFVVIVTFSSSLFSGNVRLSVLGAGYEIGTLASWVVALAIAFLIPVLFRTTNHIALLYKAVFFSAITLFVLQVLHSGFHFLIPPWSMFSDPVASVLGSWIDLGIFFGFVVILALSSIELRGEGKKVRSFLWAVLGISLVALFFVNHAPLQIVLGLFVLAILLERVIRFSKSENPDSSRRQVFRDPSFFVFLVIVVLAFARGPVGNLINFLGLQYAQIEPSWSATLEVLKGSLSVHPLLGSGPNTFQYDWLMFRPDALSLTSFWDNRFFAGTGKLPSFVAEIGYVGGLALLLFISSILVATKRVATYKEHASERMILVSSFLSAVFLWVFVIMYTPGFLLFVYAAIFTGIFIAALGFTKEYPFLEISFERSFKKSIVVYAVFLILLISTFWSLYCVGTKYAAAYFYQRVISEVSSARDMNNVGRDLERAISLDPQDLYFRGASEIGMVNLGMLLSQVKDKENPSDEERAQFSSILTFTVQSAKNATIANSHEPDNWMELGKVYENLLQLDAKTFKDSAIFAYNKAHEVSPKSPDPLVALARVEATTGDTVSAMKYLNDSLKLKPDYAVANMMIADIYITKGDTTRAISLLEQAVVSYPNNPDDVSLVMRIAALYYGSGSREKAQTIYENLVASYPNYVDARYSLGLVYDKQGMTSKAIEQFEIINKLIPGNEQVQAILQNLQAGKSALGQAKVDLTPVTSSVKSTTKKK